MLKRQKTSIATNNATDFGLAKLTVHPIQEIRFGGSKRWSSLL
jgi:hypothetical protein